MEIELSTSALHLRIRDVVDSGDGDGNEDQRKGDTGDGVDENGDNNA